MIPNHFESDGPSKIFNKNDKISALSNHLWSVILGCYEIKTYCPISLNAATNISISHETSKLTIWARILTENAMVSKRLAKPDWFKDTRASCSVRVSLFGFHE